MLKLVISRSLDMNPYKIFINNSIYCPEFHTRTHFVGQYKAPSNSSGGMKRMKQLQQASFTIFLYKRIIW